MIPVCVGRAWGAGLFACTCRNVFIVCRKVSVCVLCMWCEYGVSVVCACVCVVCACVCACACVCVVRACVCVCMNVHAC